MAGRRLGWIAGSRVVLAAVLAGLAMPATARERDQLTITPVPSAPLAGQFTLTAVGDLIYLRPMLATMEKRSPEMIRILRREPGAKPK